MNVELLERCQKIEVSCFCNADKNIRVIDPTIRPITSGLKMVGIARTIACGTDFLSLINVVSTLQASEVMVVAAGGAVVAMAGEIFCTAAKKSGASGIIVDGGFRDVDLVQKMDFPVFSKYIVPMAGKAEKIFEPQTLVEFGGVKILPGEIIVGDDDGLIVMSSEECEKIIDKAEAIQEREAEILDQVRSGKKLFEVF